MNRVLEVVFALAATYLFLSLLTSHVTELVSAFLGMRSKELEKAIGTMLRDEELTRKVLADPLVSGIRHAAPGRLGFFSRHRGPSYIGARNFAGAVLNALSPAWAEKAATPGLLSRPGAPDRGSRAFGGSTPESTDGKTADTDGSATVAAQSGAAPGPLIQVLGQSRPLQAVIGRVVTDVQGARAELEQWYDAQMARLTGVYRRKMQICIFFFGVIVTIALDASTIRIATSSWSSPVVSAAAVAAGSAYLATCGDRKEDLACATLDLPVGWGEDHTRTPLWTRLLGWLLTSFAVSLGAPFWFDLLRRIAPAVRLTGPPPASGTPAP